MSPKKSIGPEPKKAITFKLPDALIKKLKQVADTFGTSQNQIVEHGIERELIRIEKDKKPLFQ